MTKDAHNPNTPSQPFFVEAGSENLAVAPVRRSRVANFASRLLRRKPNHVTPAMDDPLADTTIDSSAEPGEHAESEPVADSYAQDMTSWESYLEQDLEGVKAELSDNSKNVEKAFSLRGKVGELYSRRERNGQDYPFSVRVKREDSLLARIDDKYGKLGELYDNETRLSNLINRRQQQVYFARKFNKVLEFADEIDTNMYRKYIGEPDQLGEAFNLPRNEQPTDDVEKATELLNGLPFVDSEALHKPYSPKHPGIVIKGMFDFPTERIIGVESFESWAGRGTIIYHSYGTPTRLKDGLGGKSFVPRHLPDIEYSSRGAIVDYAQGDREGRDNVSGKADITIVQDSAGEYWGIAHTDGSHRLAAAKLRGEKTVAIESVEISSDEDMPQLTFSVQERFRK